MERTTRAQQRAAAIDVSPAKLAAEIERLTLERDLARRQTELAREELAKLRAAGGSTGSSGPERTGTTARTRGGDGRSAKGANVADLARERDEYLAALQRERAE